MVEPGLEESIYVFTAAERQVGALRVRTPWG